ncbi:predicted protein [Plenodomus lingam JN3]|uniref:Predicted protein n=1 Tax=Leptosphaeria maculans (strain JN3 / isolate v23.1.3 / race Av1-4-5-6-7-8) TaxID=985895 RepID=E5ACB4_LEPMJ|nr:predicted protein [Plenodomus lingam JN3]CBY02116.1 predicted protein [Plenodomus lingam JN3]
MTPRHGLELPMSGPEPKPVNANGCGCTFSAAMPAVYSLSPWSLYYLCDGLLPRTHVTWVNATASYARHVLVLQLSPTPAHLSPPAWASLARKPGGRCHATNSFSRPAALRDDPPPEARATAAFIVWAVTTTSRSRTAMSYFGTYGMHCAMLLHLWAFGSYRSTFCNSGISVTVWTPTCHLHTCIQWDPTLVRNRFYFGPLQNASVMGISADAFPNGPPIVGYMNINATDYFSQISCQLHIIHMGRTS